jgi:F-type H+-transporting ATPase subunit b
VRFHLRSLPAALLLGVSLLMVSLESAHAQSGAKAQQPSSTATTQPESDNTNEQFRHAGPVRSIARELHMSTEATAQTFEDLNSAILILAILFILFKVLPKAFRGRSEVLQKQLVEARSATEQANQRLAAVEGRLAKLGDDIAAIRRQTEQDMLQDEQRIKQSLEEERARIVKAAEQEITSAGAAAQRDLKRFAAELSINQAAKRIQLSVDSDKAIVERFGKDMVPTLTPQFSKGERN